MMNHSISHNNFLVQAHYSPDTKEVNVYIVVHNKGAKMYQETSKYAVGESVQESVEVSKSVEESTSPQMLSPRSKVCDYLWGISD